MVPSSTNLPPATKAEAAGGFVASGWALAPTPTGTTYLNGALTSSNTLKLGSSDTNTAAFRWKASINSSNFPNDYISWSVTIPALRTSLKSLNLGVFPNANSANTRYAGTNFMVKYTLDGGITLNDAYLSTTLLRTNTNIINIDLASKANLQNIQNVTVEFRCYSWGGVGTSADKSECLYFYGVTNPYSESGTTPTVSLLGDVTRSKPILTLITSSSTLDENGGEVTATLTSDQTFTGASLNLSSVFSGAASPVEFRSMGGTAITSLAPSSGTSISFKIRGVPDGRLTGPRPVSVGIVSPDSSYEVPPPVTLSVFNASNEVWTNAPVAVINKVVRSLSFNTATGTLINTNADIVELLVVGNGQPGGRADLTGMVLKECATNATADKGYKYAFSPAWTNIPNGTLIVIAARGTNMPIPQVLPSEATGYLIAVGRDNASLFSRTNTGGDLATGFSIDGTDMVSLMLGQDTNFPVSAAGVNGAMHTIGFGPEITASTGLFAGLVTGSQTNGYIQKNTNTLSTGLALVVNNSHGSAVNALDDYRDDAELALAVGITASDLGVPNTAQNKAFIDYLRGQVDGTGLATLGGIDGKPLFARGSTNQTVSLQLTGTVRGSAIRNVSVLLPTNAVGKITAGQVSLSGSAAGGVTFAVSQNGDSIALSGLNLTTDNALVVNIAGLNMPNPGTGDPGTYLFMVSTAGEGGLLTPLISSPSAVVPVSIAQVRTGRSDNLWFPLAEGQKVSVEGVATCADLEESTSKFLAFLQDDTGGIAVADTTDFPAGQSYVAGHRYGIYGVLSMDRGLLRIVPEIMTDYGVASGGIPPAQPISLLDIRDEPDRSVPVSELWEGRLVCVTNLSKAGGTWNYTTTNNTTGVVTTNDLTLTIRDGGYLPQTITDSNGVPVVIDSTNRVERVLSILVGSQAGQSPEPVYPVSVLAIVSQRSTATNGTNNDAYRLLVRKAEDILYPSLQARTTNLAISNGTLVYWFTNFSTTYGTPSEAQLFKVFGNNLMADVSLRPPVGFEVSTNGSSWTAWDETVTTNDSEGNPVLAYKELVLARAQTNLVLAGTNNMVVSNTCYLRLSARAPGGQYGTNYFTNGRTLKLSTAGFTNYFDIAASTVAPVTQTITFAPFPVKTANDAPFLLTNVTASSGLPLSFSSSDTNVASVSGSTLTIKKAGTITLTAVQPGSESYLPVTNSASLTMGASPAGLADVTVALTSASYVYDGLAKGLSPTTSPGGIPCVLTYNGDLAQPKNAGTYAVTAYVNQAGYRGNKTATLTISKYPAQVLLGGLSQVANTNPAATYAVSVSTVPPGLAVAVTYAGSTNLPSTPGSYAVAATVTDPNYSGSASGMLQVIEPAPDTFLGSSGFRGIAPRVIGFNAAHYMPGGNTRAWWKYAGVSGVRIFVSADDIETSTRTSDGVTTLGEFNDQKTTLRSQGTNYGNIPWTQMKNNLANKDLGSGGGNNHLVVGHLLGELRPLGVEPLLNITASTGSFSTSSWGQKWRIYKHYYAMGYLLGRDYGVRRYQMYNEPDLGGLPSDYLARAQIASQALQDAGADLNTREGKNLRVVVAGPVNAGSAVSDFNGFNSAGSGVGDQVFSGIHAKYDGSDDPSFWLFQQWDYHQYGSDSASYASDLANLTALLDASASFGGLFPISISEFNTHTGSSFDGMSATLDDEDEASNFGAICVRLLQGGADEMYAFKFGQTESSGSVYGVAKNGIHYVNNDGSAGYDTGGVTLAGEVFRLFNKGCGPGHLLRDFAVDDGTMASLKIVASSDPASSRHHVFSANNSGSAVTWGLNLSNWGLPAGSPAIVEEVSSQENGGVVAYGYVDPTGLFYDLTDASTPTRLYQRSYSTHLYTLSGDTTNNWITVPAAEDTRIGTSVDGTADGDATGGTRTLLLAKSDPTDPTNRVVSLIKFSLTRTNGAGQVVPIRPGDISLGLLEVDAYQSAYRSAKVQAYVYGVTHSQWRSQALIDYNVYAELEPALSWSNCPLVRQGAAVGAKLSNRVVQGIGTQTEILGQIVVRTNSGATKRLDITDYLRRAPKVGFRQYNPNDFTDTNFYVTNFTTTLMVAQEPRWDKSPSIRTVDDTGSGDRQGAGVQIYSLETASTTYKGPRLKLVLAKDSDDDGLSDQSEIELYGTNPANPDENANGISDGADLLLAGINVKSGTNAGTLNIITFGSLPVKSFGDAPFSLGATATAGVVTYTSSNTNVAAVSGSTVTLRGAGTTVITARCSGTATAGPAEPVQQTLTVNKARASIGFAGPMLFSYNGTRRAATVTTEPAGLNTIVTYNGSLVAPLNAGVYEVQATIVDSNYEGSLEHNSLLTTSSLLTILGTTQTVTFNSVPAVAYGATLNLQASTDGGGAISYEVISGPGTLFGSVLTPTASSGTIVVRATAAAAGDFASASADQSVTITPAAAGISTWLAGQPTNSTNVGKYLIGGATNLNAASERAVITTNATHLVLSAIVRTNDPKGGVVGQWASQITSLATLPSGSNEVTGTRAAVQGTVPEGCERQEFLVPKTNGTGRLFLRLKATLNP